MDKNANMELWFKYSEPPKEAMKAFDNGTFKGTDISPMWRIRCLTEEFGVCGFGWYPEIVEHWTETVGAVVMTYVRIKLYIKRGDEWSKPISATGGNKALRKQNGVPSDEAYKMAYTDAIGGACKFLGIGGAVYWERGYSKYEDSYMCGKEGTIAIVSDEEYRSLAVRVHGLPALDKSCKKRFGTTFAEAPVAELKKILPIEQLEKLARQKKEYEQ